MASANEVMDINSRSSHKGGKPKLRSLEVERSANGGFIANHRFHQDDGPYHESEQHTFGSDDGEKLIGHLREQLGIEKAGKAAKAAGESSAGAAS